MKTIQRNITIIIWICSILMTFVSVLNGYEKSTIILMATTMFSVSIISTIIHFLPLRDRLKAIIVLVMVGGGCNAASIAEGGNSGAFVTSFLVLGIASIYFDPLILKIYATIYIPFSIVIYIINPDYIVGTITEDRLGIFEIAAYAVVTVSVYIGTKEGNRLMEKAREDEQEAKQQALVMEEMSIAAREHAIALYKNISISDQTVDLLSEEAEKANESILKLKQSETETIQLFNELNEKINHSTKWVEQNYQLVNALEENFETALKNVVEGKAFSKNASESLNQILSAIEHASECIEKSTKETAQISNIIRNIEEITSRTNLLAINAAIEAARVGNSGNGFLIVAEQIRTLSVQSQQASENVKIILAGLAKALNATETKVNSGLSAIQYGIGNLEHIARGLETIDLYSNQSQMALKKEVDLFAKSKDELAAMVKEVEKSMETANKNMDEIKAVADLVQSQTTRTEAVSEQLKEMDGMANQLTKQFG